MVKTIAVDMDGTFLDPKRTYDKLRFETNLIELRNRDITFITTSDNQYVKLRSIFGDKGTYFISESDVIIYRDNGLYSYKNFSRQMLQQVVDYLNMNQSIDQLVICGLKSAYILRHTSETFREDTRSYYHQLKEADSLQRLPEDDYVKIAFNTNRETYPSIDERVAAQFSNDIKLVPGGHDSTDIIMSDMTKGQALKRLLDKWGISPSELIAFGDANNDKDMLAFAKHSCVMENSHDEELFNIALAAAPSNGKQGVLTIIEQEVLKK